MANVNGNGSGQSAPTYTYRPTKETPPEVFQYIVTQVKRNKKDTTGIPFREFVDGLVAFRLGHAESAVTAAEGTTEDNDGNGPKPPAVTGGSGLSEKDKREIVDAISKRIQSTSDSVKNYVKSTIDENMGSIPTVVAGDGTVPAAPVSATISPDELRQIEDSVSKKLDTLANAIGKALDSTQGGIRGDVRNAIGTTRGDIVKAIQSGNSEISAKLSQIASQSTVSEDGGKAAIPTAAPITLPDDLKRQLLGIARDISDLKRSYSDLIEGQQAASAPQHSGIPSMTIGKPDTTGEHVAVKRPKDGDAASVGGDAADMSSIPTASALDEGIDDEYAISDATFDDSDVREPVHADDAIQQEPVAAKSDMTIDDILSSLDDATEDIQSVLGDTGGSYPIDASDARAFARRIMGEDEPDVTDTASSARTSTQAQPAVSDGTTISLDDVYDGIGGTAFPDADGGGSAATSPVPQADDGSTDMGNIVNGILDDDWGNMLDDIGGDEDASQTAPETSDPQPASYQQTTSAADLPNGELSVTDLDDVDFDNDGTDDASDMSSAPQQAQGHRKLILPDRIRRKENGAERYHIDMTAKPQAQQTQFLAEEDDDFDL